jgi:GAF domain-containing protein
MADFPEISGSTRKEKYEQLLAQTEELIADFKHPIGVMSHLCSCLKEYFHFLWVGYYIKCENELIIGPYQGPPACLKIPFGKGVCGTAWKENRTIIVPDVEKFPGHIACSSLSRSEIVVPLFNNKGVFYGVLDIDSDIHNDFNDTDAYYLQKINTIISKIIHD